MSMKVTQTLPPATWTLNKQTNDALFGSQKIATKSS